MTDDYTRWAHDALAAFTAAPEPKSVEDWFADAARKRWPPASADNVKRATAVLKAARYFPPSVQAIETLAAEIAAAEQRGARQMREIDELRTTGWLVAVHNDYRQEGRLMTFWLLTKDGRAIKGEGQPTQRR